MSETVVNEVEEAEEAEDEGTNEEDADQGEGNGEATEPELIAQLVSPHGLTPEQVERRFASVKKSWGTYKASVERNLDFLEQGRLTECPMCKEDHPGYIDLHDAGKYPEEVSTVVLQFLGFATEIAYKEDPDTGTCQRCDGEGIVATGSKVKTAKKKLCPACKGFGFQPPPGEDPLVAPISVAPLQPVTETAVPVNTDNVDPWGEPRILPDGRDNPNFQKMPQFKIPVQPWGQTAGLGATHPVADVA